MTEFNGWILDGKQIYVLEDFSCLEISRSQEYSAAFISPKHTRVCASRQISTCLVLHKHKYQQTVYIHVSCSGRYKLLGRRQNLRRVSAGHKRDLSLSKYSMMLRINIEQLALYNHIRSLNLSCLGKFDQICRIVK